MSKIEFKVHSLKQEQAIRSRSKILLLATGTQYGKTTVGALRMKHKLHTHTDKDDNFLITSPTYKILQQSTLPAFLKFMEGYGKYDKKFDIFKMNHGSTVYCRTETDPDSIVGITNIKHVWGDEAGKYGKYFWENMQARADFCGCGIDLTTSPYSLNWVYKELIKPKMNGKRDDLDYITAASWENPYHSLHDPEVRLAKERTMDARRFRMIYGGVFEKMEGLVYDCFDENLHVIDSFNLGAGVRYYAGIDWGYYPDPFVIIIRAVTTSGLHIQVGELCQTRLTLTDQVRAAKQKMSIWNIERFYADPSQPGSIEEFNRNGLPTVGAENDIRLGVDAHYELIKENKFKIFKGTSPYTLDELSTYHYPEEQDIKPDQNINRKHQLPVDQNNHCMDAVRYLTAALRLGLHRKTPIVSSDTPDKFISDNAKRIERLKNRKNFYGQED